MRDRLFWRQNYANDSSAQKSPVNGSIRHHLYRIGELTNPHAYNKLYRRPQEWFIFSLYACVYLIGSYFWPSHAATSRAYQSVTTRGQKPLPSDLWRIYSIWIISMWLKWLLKSLCVSDRMLLFCIFILQQWDYLQNRINIFLLSQNVHCTHKHYPIL
jgi:hypothetical protein